jgi:hypothetical protein
LYLATPKKIKQPNPTKIMMIMALFYLLEVTIYTFHGWSTFPIHLNRTFEEPGATKAPC